MNLGLYLGSIWSEHGNNLLIFDFLRMVVGCGVVKEAMWSVELKMYLTYPSYSWCLAELGNI